MDRIQVAQEIINLDVHMKHKKVTDVAIVGLLHAIVYFVDGTNINVYGKFASDLRKAKIKEESK